MTNPIPDLVPIVSNDFIDAFGERNFTFQLCEKTANGLSGVAIITIEGEARVTRRITTAKLERYLEHFVAMAFEYQSRSIPVRFPRVTISA